MSAIIITIFLANLAVNNEGFLIQNKNGSEFHFSLTRPINIWPNMFHLKVGDKTLSEKEGKILLSEENHNIFYIDPITQYLMINSNTGKNLPLKTTEDGFVTISEDIKGNKIWINDIGVFEENDDLPVERIIEIQGRIMEIMPGLMIQNKG